MAGTIPGVQCMLSQTMQEELHERARMIALDRARWLEGILKELIEGGHSPADIEVQQFQNQPMRTVVVVAGVPRYEWNGKFVVKGDEC